MASQEKFKTMIGGQALIEGIMMRIMYEIPSMNDVEKCVTILMYD